jgi:hypothetical protein
MILGLFLFGLLAIVVVVAFFKMKARSGQWDE